jgi:surfactin synthase thioesterase subunit
VTPTRNRSSWLLPLTSPEHTVVDLVAFPGAGAGPHFYQEWRRVMPPGWRLNAVCLPGRGSRFGEPFATDMRALARDLGARIAEERSARPGTPLVLFGHSMGALVALEVAAMLRPALLAVAGCAPPASERRAVYGANAEADLAEAVRDLVGSLGVPDPGLFEELVALSTPILAADLVLLDGYRPADFTVDCDILAMYGEDDLILPESWQQSTSLGAAEEVHAGGHFFIQHAAADAIAALVRRLPAAHR